MESKRWYGPFLEGLKRYHYPLGLIIITVAVATALWQLQDLQREQEYRSELRAHQLCVNQVDTRLVLNAVLERLAEPRDTDEPGDLEEREILLDQVQPLIEPPDCPPEPTRP